MDIHARLGDTVKKARFCSRFAATTCPAAIRITAKPSPTRTLAQHATGPRQGPLRPRCDFQSDLRSGPGHRRQSQGRRRDTAEHLRLLGNDPDQPNGIVDIHAPVSGVITDQQVTNAAAVQAYGTNPFTISDMSSVWVVCDVHENDLACRASGRRGAKFALNAYPGQSVQGRDQIISGQFSIRIFARRKCASKSRNPGIMRLGHVRDGHVPRAEAGDTYASFRPRRSASPRSRLGLRARARTRNFSAWKSQRRHAYPETCRKFCPASAGHAVVSTLALENALGTFQNTVEQ